MGRNRIAAAVGAAVITTALTVGRPHRMPAAPPAPPAKTESEIRSLDIEFY
jgi:hypothetical protein